MKHLVYILSFLTWVHTIFLPDIFRNETEVVKTPNKKKIDSYCGVFSNKRTFEAELVARVLDLKCDSTFTFRTTACWCYGISAGTWYVRNDVIYLKTSAEILAKRKQNAKRGSKKNPCSNQWLDFTGSSIINKDSVIIWKLPGTHLDTLSRD